MRTEVRLHMDKTSRLDGAFTIGDNVKTLPTERDHPVSMKCTQPTK
jgi:hypothetical protein